MLLGSFRDVVSFDVVSTTITIGADADVPLLWLLGISALLSFVRIIGYEFGRTSMIGSFYGLLIMDCYLSSYDIYLRIGWYMMSSVYWLMDCFVCVPVAGCSTEHGNRAYRISVFELLISSFYLMRNRFSKE